MSIYAMREFLAARYSKKWVETKSDNEVIRIYHRILAQEEERSKHKNGQSH